MTKEDSRSGSTAPATTLKFSPSWIKRRRKALKTHLDVLDLLNEWRDSVEFQQEHCMEEGETLMYINAGSLMELLKLAFDCVDDLGNLVEEDLDRKPEVQDSDAGESEDS